MILKHKKTSQIVDAAIHTNQKGSTMATYWLKGVNNGQGGWVTTKIGALVPVDVETKNEKHSNECQAIVNEREQMYKDMFDGIYVEKE